MLTRNPATLRVFFVIEKTLNKGTTVFNLQNMFLHSHVIFSCKWAFNGCTVEFFIKVRYKIMRQNLR